ncbi:MAG: lipopolysaccharide kinase InaA family protein [Candidatus Binataceae bacterium]
MLYAKSPQWAAVAIKVEDLMAGAGFSLLKDGGRTRAGVLACDGSRVFVKRIASGSWLKGVAERVRGSRATRTLRGAAVLSAGGFAHPEPLAALEHRSFGAVTASYVLSEVLVDARMMSVFALAGGRNFRRRKWVSETVAREVRRLHDAGIYTRDLQETNLMLAAEAEGAPITIYFVDLEDFRLRRRVSMKWRLRNLVHLDRSIGRFVSSTQRLRFLYNYLGGKPVRAETRQVVGRLRALRARIDTRGGRALAPRPAAGGEVGGVAPQGFSRAGVGEN